MADQVSKTHNLKEEGNNLFNAGDYAGAVTLYTKALKLSDGSESLVYLKNRAAAHLKLGHYREAVEDTSKAIELAPTDVKALFRRCQAYEQLQKYEDAFKDAKTVHHLDPHNSAVQPVLRRLSVKLQEMVKEQSSTFSRTKQMMDLFCGEATDLENRILSANNLLVLSKDNAGAELVLKEKAPEKIAATMRKIKSEEFHTACIRVLSQLCLNSTSRACTVLDEIGVPFLVACLNSKCSTYATAVQYLVQTLFNSLSGMDSKNGKKADPQLLKENEKRIDEIMYALVKSVASRTLPAIGRDVILEIIMKNVDWENLNWGTKLVDGDGLDALLEVASELRDIRYESSMNVTDNTRTNVSVTLERVYTCMDHDGARKKYQDKVLDFINEKLKTPGIEEKVRAAAAITVLLQGPLDVGNNCLAQQGVVEMMLAMAGSEDEIQQRVAAEAIVAAASKKDKCTSIISMGAGVLKKLYQSKNESIKVRALVGLCKVGSFGGTDASIRPFDEGSGLKLASACRKFLVNPAKDKDLRKWAAEGLAYLTLDAEVKEELVADSVAMNALIDLAKTGDLSVVYGVVTTLVNLTNSYDKQEILPELKQLAKFAKQHVPEEHFKDSKEFLEKRLAILSKLGVTTALVVLANTESSSCKELISRVFNAICELQETRGTVVQQGGTKTLLKLAVDNTANGKLESAQALARIGITINPEIAFPGQRCAEVVRPITELLHPNCTGLQNFEAMMALTNLAQVGPSVRSQILKESGLSKIENFMYDEHEMLKRAACQCLVNLMLSDEVVTVYEGENDRVKLLVILSEEEDVDTARAASGALAMLTSVSEKACKKVFDAKAYEEILCKLAASEDKELQHRGVVIIHNLIHAGKETAEKIIETRLLEVLLALARPEIELPEKIKTLVTEALKKAEDWKLIKPNEENPNEDA